MTEHEIFEQKLAECWTKRRQTLANRLALALPEMIQYPDAALYERHSFLHALYPRFASFKVEDIGSGKLSVRACACAARPARDPNAFCGLNGAWAPCDALRCLEFSARVPKAANACPLAFDSFAADCARRLQCLAAADGVRSAARLFPELWPGIAALLARLPSLIPAELAQPAAAAAGAWRCGLRRRPMAGSLLQSLCFAKLESFCQANSDWALRPDSQISKDGSLLTLSVSLRLSADPASERLALAIRRPALNFFSFLPLRKDPGAFLEKIAQQSCASLLELCARAVIAESPDSLAAPLRARIENLEMAAAARPGSACAGKTLRV